MDSSLIDLNLLIEKQNCNSLITDIKKDYNLSKIQINEEIFLQLINFLDTYPNNNSYIPLAAIFQHNEIIENTILSNYILDKLKITYNNDKFTVVIPFKIKNKLLSLKEMFILILKYLPIGSDISDIFNLKRLSSNLKKIIFLVDNLELYPKYIIEELLSLSIDQSDQFQFSFIFIMSSTPLFLYNYISLINKISLNIKIINYNINDKIISKSLFKFFTNNINPNFNTIIPFFLGPQILNFILLNFKFNKNSLKSFFNDLENGLIISLICSNNLTWKNINQLLKNLKDDQIDLDIIRALPSFKKFISYSLENNINLSPNEILFLLNEKDKFFNFFEYSIIKIFNVYNIKSLILEIINLIIPDELIPNLIIKIIFGFNYNINSYELEENEKFKTVSNFTNYLISKIDNFKFQIIRSKINLIISKYSNIENFNFKSISDFCDLIIINNTPIFDFPFYELIYYDDIETFNQMLHPKIFKSYNKFINFDEDSKNIREKIIQSINSSSKEIGIREYKNAIKDYINPEIAINFLLNDGLIKIQKNKIIKI